MATNPQDRPDYHHPDYDYMAPILAVVGDCYGDLYGVKERYLPKADNERDRPYKERVARAVFNNRIRPAIDANAGLLTAFEISDYPPSLEEYKDDVDGKGSNLKSFLRDADAMAQRDRHCFILVDSPPAPQERTAADRLVNPVRPKLHLIDRRSVLNWRLTDMGGSQVLTQVTVGLCERVEDGRFGTKSVHRYHVLSLVENGVQHEVLEIDDRGETALLSSTVSNLPQIPLVCYPFTSSPFGIEIPPFYKAALLNIKLFQKDSALDEIEYRVNCPTLWRKSEDSLEMRPPMTLGASWIIELMQGDDVGVLEISGQSIAALQVSIDEIKRDIDRETGAFLVGSGKVSRTATEASLAAMSLSASLTGYARAKASAIKAILNLWCLFTGEENETEVQQDESVLEVPLEPQEIQALLGLFNAGVLSHQTLLELLRMGRQLPPNFDVEQELERLGTERNQEQATPQIEPADLSDQEDF